MQDVEQKKSSISEHPSAGKGTGCRRCGKALEGKQTAYCSMRCGKLFLKSQYRRRRPGKVKEWKVKYKGNYPKPEVRGAERSRIIRQRGSACERCGTAEDLQVHHWKPTRYKGGDKDYNLAVFCRSCHGYLHAHFYDTAFWKL